MSNRWGLLLAAVFILGVVIGVRTGAGLFFPGETNELSDADGPDPAPPALDVNSEVPPPPAALAVAAEKHPEASAKSPSPVPPPAPELSPPVAIPDDPAAMAALRDGAPPSLSPPPLLLATAGAAASVAQVSARISPPEGGVGSWISVSCRMEGSLYASVQQAVAPLGMDAAAADVLSANLKRTLIWDLKDLSSSVLPGDRLEALFERIGPQAEDIRLLAVRYHSRKLGKDIEGYYFKRPKEPFGRWYSPQGVDLALSMTNGPVAVYEQITALLGDGRRHKGVDFKAPVGAPIVTPFNARVLRTTWNFRGNGNSVELRYVHNGMQAIFLHMDSLAPSVKPGAYLKAGEKIGAVGNTGRSYAAHLHYQLERPPGTVLDPMKQHAVTHLKLDDADMPAFRQVMVRFQQALR